MIVPLKHGEWLVMQASMGPQQLPLLQLVPTPAALQRQLLLPLQRPLELHLLQAL